MQAAGSGWKRPYLPCLKRSVLSFHSDLISAEQVRVRMATTTSTDNSGLPDSILPHFTKAGGNIRGYTRTMTTTIALETSKGNFALGITLGLILLVVALSINLTVEMEPEQVEKRKITLGGRVAAFIPPEEVKVLD